MATYFTYKLPFCLDFGQIKKQLHCCNCLIFRAENETRTRDPNLGKVVLYQLSYFRII